LAALLSSISAASVLDPATGSIGVLIPVSQHQAATCQPTLSEGGVAPDLTCSGYLAMQDRWVQFSWIESKPSEEMPHRLFTGYMGIVWSGVPVIDIWPDQPAYPRITPEPFFAEIELRDTIPGTGYAQAEWCRRCNNPVGGGFDYRFGFGVETPVFKLGVESVIFRIQASVYPFSMGYAQSMGIQEPGTVAIYQVPAPVPEPNSVLLLTSAIPLFFLKRRLRRYTSRTDRAI
jgi:hypothetical protein